MPAMERVGRHELSYRPERRFAAMSKFMREPRGAKSVEHLENLRQSDPMYGSLLPSSTIISRAAAALACSIDRPVDLDGCPTTTSSSNSDEGEEEYDRGLLSLPRQSGSGRLPRILSNHLFEDIDEFDNDDQMTEPPWTSSPRSSYSSSRPSRPWAPPTAKLNPAYQSGAPHLRPRRSSYEDDETFDDMASVSARSLARTSLERSSERSSNNTICDFLEESTDLSGSGDWSSFMRNELPEAVIRADLKSELKGMAEYAPPPAATAQGKAHTKERMHAKAPPNASTPRMASSSKEKLPGF